MGDSRAGPSHPGAGRTSGDDAIVEIESALFSLVRSLKQVRLHEYLLARARVDVDRAGTSLLYVLYVEGRSLRITDLAEQLQIEAPAVTRKAQQLELAGLISRTPDLTDRRATQLQLSAQGRRTISRILGGRREWLTTMLSDWPEASQVEFARLVSEFTSIVDQFFQELDA